MAGEIDDYILLLFAYTGLVPHRSCVVSFTDSEGIEHSVRVLAASLYEAAALALAEFRRHGFADTTFGAATKLTVKIQEPEMSHTVSVSRLRSWLEGVGKIPVSTH
jgi:hypothetical protein